MHFLEYANIRECFLCWPQEIQFAIRYITQWGQNDTSTRKESCYNKYPWWISLTIFWHLKNIHLPSIYLATAKLERPCNHILRLVWVILYPITNNIVFLYFLTSSCSRPMVSMLHEWKRMIFEQMSQVGHVSELLHDIWSLAAGCCVEPLVHPLFSCCCREQPGFLTHSKT